MFDRSANCISQGYSNHKQSFPRPHPLPGNPRLPHTPIIIQNHQIRPPPNLQLPPAPITHKFRNILRSASHSLRNTTSTPPHQIPHTLAQTRTPTNQRLSTLNRHPRAGFGLVERDLRVSRVCAIR